MLKTSCASCAHLLNRPYADLLTCQKRAKQAEFTHRALPVFVERNGTSQTKTGEAKSADNIRLDFEGCRAC
jgi:hypothetical protein